ncbi:unnamed protein product [Trichobilharzia regenti]|nr:unnamed protein product [Trichobilharzia regenti]
MKSKTESSNVNNEETEYTLKKEDASKEDSMKTSTEQQNTPSRNEVIIKRCLNALTSHMSVSKCLTRQTGIITKQPCLVDSVFSDISSPSVSNTYSKSDSDFHSDDVKIYPQTEMTASVYSDQAAELNLRSFSK